MGGGEKHSGLVIGLMESLLQEITCTHYSQKCFLPFYIIRIS